MAVKDYNTDPDFNTTISGINIAEGCPPSGINDAIRQLMADVKEASEEQASKDTEQDTAISEAQSSADAAVKKVDGELPDAEGNVPLDNVVHRKGSETIAGVKTLTNYMQIQNTDVAVETWVSQTNNRYLQYVDKNGVPISAIQFRMTPTVNAIRFLARKPKEAESALSSHSLLAAEQDENGVARAYCISPAANSNTNDIATTAWVRGKGVLIESWTSGANWYRKYSDGWIEQGGFIAASTEMGAVSQTYHTPFTTARCPILIGYSTDTGIDEVDAQHISAYSKTGFTAIRTNRGSEAVGLQWYVCGY